MEGDQSEVFLVIVSTVFLSFITLNLYAAFGDGWNWKRLFVVDFITLITPLLLLQTLASDHLIMFGVTLLAVCAVKINSASLDKLAEDQSGDGKRKGQLNSGDGKRKSELNSGDGKKKGRLNKSEKIKEAGNRMFGNAGGDFGCEKSESSLERDCVTNLRSTTNVLSVIAILAVDFNIFPAKFCKSETHGFTLMDVGVGTYVVTNAMVAREIRGKTTPMKKHVREAAIMFGLGLFRYFTLSALGFQPNVREYGEHWNFFFTLAATKIISAIFLTSSKANNYKTYAIKGATVLAIHQIALSTVLEDFVFHEALPRDNFFNANREGIVSVMGFSALHILQIAASSHKNHFAKLTTLAAITLLLNVFFKSSRCVANSTYCFMILTLSAILHALYGHLGGFVRRCYNLRSTTFIFEAVNYNPLVFFMTANLCTGLVNLVFTTTDFNAFEGVVILMVYLFVNCLIVSVMYVKKIKIKG